MKESQNANPPKSEVPGGVIIRYYFLDFFPFEAFFKAFADFCLITAWAAANLAIGTLNGEQLT